MIHAICDFCGKDCDRTAMLVTITPFQNFARYHDDTHPAPHVDDPASFVMCSKCRDKHQLPNPFDFNRSSGVTNSQSLKYDVPLDSNLLNGNDDSP